MELKEKLKPWVNGIPHLFDLYEKEMTVIVSVSFLAGLVLGIIL
jgi:hypothetical protein